ncbi:16S rRNA (guanine(966)-N(2))-methyltransferase RsmD [Alicyclobacillus sp. SO9]|uniref:16S rRNA (guanine(966)-N(2))-methyltransferase RsmD n=1 Tax=Alicyclobacillus sp. SO9 TaxID=2665646 RepID=UPI0018E8B018|nr:16S rRNA (guanine(966)-N(2))-methyltransferase RsmD [Alicyclobacillus sp. SO9]QQE80754.1 16S rRNA (guanine(966)-N(2))-methyltransferase RsmD [Alicyclobacillus sp. SO9]
MRIISGEWKGLRLQGPKGAQVRPTTDRVKEAMFNLMGSVHETLPVVDLFAGSGGLGLEALSRGAAHAVFVDKSGLSLKVLKENISRCGAESRSSVRRMDWKEALSQLRTEHKRLGWVFVDPPYRMDLWESVLEFLQELGFEMVNGIVCEHGRQYQLPQVKGVYEMFKQRAYGDIVLTLYRERN